MISIPYTTVDSLIKLLDIDIVAQKNTIKTKLEKFLKHVNYKHDKAAKKKYVEKLLTLHTYIITAKPETLKRYKDEFDKIITPEKMASSNYKSFRNRVLKELGYSNKRGEFYPKYFHKMGVKSCVYCNSQLTVATEGEKRLKTKTNIVYKAKFQVDHYIPKSSYPCFSISLYNLYPVCASCNNCKSYNTVQFSLYQNIGNPVSDFEFILDKASVTEYLLNRKANEIKYEFKEPHASLPNKKLNDVFDIEGIYNTQKDLVEELILKAEIYTEEYKKSLIKKFPKLLTSADITNRILLGNYTSEIDIHKRPMAKFTLDIAKQVGLIKR